MPHPARTRARARTRTARRLRTPGRAVVLGVSACAALAACTAGGGEATPSPSAEPRLAVSDPSVVLPYECRDDIAPEETFRIPLDDEETIDGMVVGDGETAVVFANQAEDDLCGWLPTARRWQEERGWTSALLVYSQAQGAGEDVARVAEALREAGATTLYLVGGSMGGTAVLDAANRLDPPPDAVVALSPPTAYGGANAAEAVTVTCAPTLFVVADGDTDFVGSTQELHDACVAEDKQHLVVPGAVHGEGLLGAPDVVAAVEEWLGSH